jgi:hypothetical protein
MNASCLYNDIEQFHLIHSTNKQKTDFPGRFFCAFTISDERKIIAPLAEFKCVIGMTHTDQIVQSWCVILFNYQEHGEISRAHFFCVVTSQLGALLVFPEVITSLSESSGDLQCIY